MKNYLDEYTMRDAAEEKHEDAVHVHEQHPSWTDEASVWGIRRALMAAYGNGAETTAAQYELEKIAQYELQVETLSTRSSDSLDFHNIAVWGIHNALRQAAAAGRKANKKAAAPKTAAGQKRQAAATATSNQIALFA